jgi:hypothetical protein
MMWFTGLCAFVQTQHGNSGETHAGNLPDPFKQV